MAEERIAAHVLEFDVVSVDANSGGAQSGGPRLQIYHFTLVGPHGKNLQKTFSTTTRDIAVQKQDPAFYVIDCPLSEHAPTLAQLQAMAGRTVRARVYEAPYSCVGCAVIVPQLAERA